MSDLNLSQGPTWTNNKSKWANGKCGVNVFLTYYMDFVFVWSLDFAWYGREKVWRLMRLHHCFLYVNEGGVHSHVITIPNFRLADLSLPLYLKTLIPLILTQHYMTLIRNNFF